KTQTEALENQLKAAMAREDHHRAFLGTLAHELRNPLAPLVTAAELIRRRSSKDDVTASSLQVIDRQIAALTRLVDDLMDTVRIGVGKIEVRKELIDLQEVVAASADSIRAAAASRGHDFQLITVEGPVPVQGDAQRLEQVCVNLLNNAIKYTPR